MSMYEREQERFAIFLNLTKPERRDMFGYDTQREFAKDHELPHEKILSEWKRNPKFKKKKREIFMNDFEDILPEAKASLRRRAVDDGDVNALKEIFKISGLSVERIEQVSSNDVMFVIETVSKILKDKLTSQPALLNEIAKELEEQLGEL